jgi:hypothetical protein
LYDAQKTGMTLILSRPGLDSFVPALFCRHWLNILDASSASDTVYMYGGDVGRYLYVQTGSGA